MPGTDALITNRKVAICGCDNRKNLTSKAASDGDDKGVVLETLKSRKATSAFDTPSQVVIAAYNHEDMLDTSDEPHEVPVHGTYFNKVWTLGNGGSKVTNGDMRIVRQYVRASRLFIPRDGAEHMPERLPVEIPGESAIPAVYVGISGVAIQHVFMRDKTKDKATVFEEQPAPMARLVRQNNRVLQYLPVEPLQNLKVSDDAGHQPSHCTLYHRNGIDTHWVYHATPLGIIEPPKELIDRLNIFLSIYHLGSMPTKPAVDLEMARRLGWKQMGGIEAMIYEVMNAMAEGSLPNVCDIESLTTNGTTMQETAADPEEPPVSSDEPVDVQELENLDPHRARQYHDAITELTVRAVDWKPLIDTLNVRRPIQAEVLSMVETLGDYFGEEAADGARFSRVDLDEIDETTKVWLMSRRPTVIARLAVVFIRR
ncbi:hypothetical protein FMUND_9893 [Fusarium mundagurra]|uniref:Uncharacterized protein n=1 Tax=Fusarium mundagurra TaxID=1567541 RepID=A0A8H5YCF1_9HYPO|nr:hypothetical protein FMUND_9893 [Fusarium mundagurra]